jgi:uncharacterized protein with HEPN domain
MSERSAKMLIEDILDAVSKIEKYVSGMTFDAFKRDDRTCDAVVRNLEIIGEAANRLPADFMEKNLHIEWHEIIGLRNRIVHHYFGVDLAMIWQIIRRDLGEFKKKLSKLDTGE